MKKARKDPGKRRRSAGWTLMLVAMVATVQTVAHAEVMDKEPSILILVIWAIVGVLLPWWLRRQPRWLLLVTLVLGLSWPALQLQEDADLHGAIHREAPEYWWLLVASIAAIGLSHVVVWRRRRLAMKQLAA